MYKIIGADGKEYGPVSLEQLRQWLAEGRVNVETRIRPDGGPDWVKLGELPEFAGPAPQPIYPPGFQTIAAEPLRMNGFGITGLILGVISLPMSVCCAGVPFNVLGIVFSGIALAQIKNRPTEFTGKGIALGGLICSIIGLLLGITILTLSIAYQWDQLFLKGKEL